MVIYWNNLNKLQRKKEEVIKNGQSRYTGNFEQKKKQTKNKNKNKNKKQKTHRTNKQTKIITINTTQHNTEN